jgi:circadian clock protein KaiC
VLDKDRPEQIGVLPLQKSPTGISGLDEITGGGLPQGRPTLVCGGAGSGKTLLATEFLVHGATQYGEPGVLVCFEETANDLITNSASLGFDLEDLIARKKLFIEHVRVERREIEETGEYDLEGLFIRLGYAIDSIGAKRIVLDTLEALFAALSNDFILRSELRRLFGWLKDKGMTALITAERGQGTLSRHGLEEYVSDCVILLDHRVDGQVSTRRLRIVKYRGSSHCANEYPFLIDEHGFSVLPVTSLGLQHSVSNERIPSGIARLDAMLGGQGYFRGSSILVSGTAGSGKTSLAAHFVDAACRRGERCMYFTFEESESQILRNMRSIGLDLEQWIDKHLLKFHALRPTAYGLEMHLATLHKRIGEFKPRAIVIDPVTNFTLVGEGSQIQTMLMRLIDFLKGQHITMLMTSLTTSGGNLEQSEVGISSLIDTWLLVREIESNGERNRGMYILKSRGMAHSNQIREFRLTGQGIQLLDVYVGPGGVLTGSARLAQEARDNAESAARQEEIKRQRLALQRKRKALEAQIAALQAELEMEMEESKALIDQEQIRDDHLKADREAMAQNRQADEPVVAGNNKYAKRKGRQP